MNQNNTIEINSLSQYFAVIERYGLDRYVSRGQAEAYPEILSSALRPYHTKRKYYGKQQLDEFYNIIGNDLTPMQQEHFLAFAQHNGFPTNLIDFTYSPLISLFFACYDENAAAKSNDGYVYFIPKESLLHTDGSTFSSSSKIWEGYLRLCENALTDYREMKEMQSYEEYEDDCVFEQQLLLCLQSLMKFLPAGYEKNAVYKRFAHFLSQPFDNKNLYKDMQEAYACMEYYRKRLETEKEFGDFNFYINYYADCKQKGTFAFLDKYQDMDPEVAFEPDFYNHFHDLLRFFVQILMDIRDIDDTCHAFTLPYYYAYQPPNISGRINNQNSIFIYQMHIAQNDWFSSKMIYQTIQPSYVLKIRQKAAMLQQLDSVGINLKSIYGDYDSISRYIRLKFER